MSKIEWTDKTINPAVGCSPVSAACDHCYAARMATRLAGNPKAAQRYVGVVRDGAWTGQVNLFPEVMKQSLRRKVPTRFFVGSMTDLFHPSVPLHFLDKVFAYMCLAPQHTFQILTKRPGRMREYLLGMFMTAGWKRRLQMQLPPELQRSQEWRDCRSPLGNVWLGVTVEDQATADARIPELLKTPAAVRFISVEPMLGPVDLSAVRYCADPVLGMKWGLDWVICGGETGPGARPMHPDWARLLRDQCAASGVPFFFKQWGEFRPKKKASPVEDTRKFRDGDVYAVESDGRHEEWIYDPEVFPWSEDMWWMDRIGKKKAGRILDGQEWNEFPEVRNEC